MDNLLYRALASQHSWMREHPDAKLIGEQIISLDTPNEHIYILASDGEQAVFHTDRRDNLIDVTILPLHRDN